MIPELIRPDHPITIERNARRIVVVVTGRVVADTPAALILREASYLPVQYIPLKDVDTALLEQMTTHILLSLPETQSGAGKPARIG